MERGSQPCNDQSRTEIRQLCVGRTSHLFIVCFLNYGFISRQLLIDRYIYIFISKNVCIDLNKIKTSTIDQRVDIFSEMECARCRLVGYQNISRIEDR